MRFIKTDSQTGSESTKSGQLLTPRPDGQKDSAMDTATHSPLLMCDDGFDMFSEPLHVLDDELAKAQDPYTLGYLQGVKDFRVQIAIINSMEKV